LGRDLLHLDERLVEFRLGPVACRDREHGGEKRELFHGHTLRSGGWDTDYSPASGSSGAAATPPAPPSGAARCIGAAVTNRATCAAVPPAPSCVNRTSNFRSNAAASASPAAPSTAHSFCLNGPSAFFRVL